MEVELKFRVDRRQTFEWLLTCQRLDQYQLVPFPIPEQQRNIYYDTPERTFAAQRCSLRVRELGQRRVATVKRSLSTVNGLHQRQEWEVLIGPYDHPRFWPVSEARDQALLLLGSAELQPLLAIHTRRHRIQLLRESQYIAELCLDEGHIVARNRVIGFRELEIEQRGVGTLTDLMIVSQLLQKQVPLVAENRGKRSRGVALLERLAPSALLR